jgi:hypothetical protein
MSNPVDAPKIKTRLYPMFDSAERYTYWHLDKVLGHRWLTVTAAANWAENNGYVPEVDFNFGNTHAWKITASEQKNVRFTEDPNEAIHFASQGHAVETYRKEGPDSWQVAFETAVYELQKLKSPYKDAQNTHIFDKALAKAINTLHSVRRKDNGEDRTATEVEVSAAFKVNELSDEHILSINKEAIATFLGANGKGTIYAVVYARAIEAAVLASIVPTADARWLHVDEVKQLCRDFSSRTGSVYIKDVESALDGLAAQPSAAKDAPAVPKLTNGI